MAACRFCPDEATWASTSSGSHLCGNHAAMIVLNRGRVTPIEAARVDAHQPHGSVGVSHADRVTTTETAVGH